MEEVPADLPLDAEHIVEHLRTLRAAAPGAAPRGWAPQVTYDGLAARIDRQSVLYQPAIAHLHQFWNVQALGAAPLGRHPRTWLRRFVHRYLEAALGPYFRQELEFRAALTQAIDAIARRLDEVVRTDERELLTVVRDDLFDLAAYVESRTGRGGWPAEPG